MSNDCFQNTKRKFQIVIILINLICFLMIPFRVNSKDVNYVEYTSLSKSISNCYIIIILLIMLIHSIFPKMMLFGIKENLSILTSDRGKLVLIITIGILFWTSDNKIHTFFTVINFITFFALFLCEFIFDCKFLKKSDKNLNNNKIEINTEQIKASKNSNFDSSLVSQKPKEINNNSISF